MQLMKLKIIIAIAVFASYLTLLGYLYLGIGKSKVYPAKPITIVVHSKPGSAIDFMARKTADIAGKYCDVPFTVENRSGTQGLVAMQYVLDNKSDGYTLLGVTKSFLSTVIVNRSKVSMNDFLFVANMVSDPEAIISNEERNFHSLEDVIRDAETKNKPQVWIGPGTGSRDNLMAMKCAEKLGIDIKWIDYKSGPQSILAMLRNEGAVYVGNPADIKGKNGLNIISIASEKRLEALPEIPTFKEQGYNLNESMWRGFAFKKGVPEVAVRYVTEVLRKVVNDPEWKEYCNETFVFSDFEEHKKFTERVKRETDETIAYLEKAGLMVSYIKEGHVSLWLAAVIILILTALLLFILNRFSIRDISYDQIVAGGMFWFALFFLYQTFLFQIPVKVNITSPALIPGIWIFVLLFLSILLMIRSKTEKKTVNAAGYGKVVLIIIGYLVLYLILMQWAGYFLTTPVFILATMFLLKYRKIEFMTINAFGFVLFSYFVFNRLLQIDLPLGWWFG
jgi:tripartite-type tricarboxylate transporter receptor subunit TctC